MPANPTLVEAAILGLVADNGELNETEIIDLVREQIDDAEEDTIRKRITKLDRAGHITRQNPTKGFQVTANGRGSLDGLRAKMEARHIAPYTNWAPVVVQFRLMSPTLGHITDPGNAGISRFPRLGEEVELIERQQAVEAKKRPGRPGQKQVSEPVKYQTVVDRKVTREGQVMILGGAIMTALMKASKKTDATVMVGDDGIRRVLPDVAWTRVSIKPCIFPLDTRLTRSVRRPTNVQGVAIGEIVHESLPPGTLLTIRASFPLSHFSPAYLVRIFESAEDVGISAAGAGRGGMWGVGAVESMVVNGVQVWPGHADTKPLAGSVKKYTHPASEMTPPDAGDMLESHQTPVAVPSTDGAKATTVAEMAPGIGEPALASRNGR